MYGLFFLLEFKTIDRATNSFPVPFSPYINTLAFVDAAWDIANFTFFIARDSPKMISYSSLISGISSFGFLFKTLFIVSRTFDIERGFSIKSMAPFFVAVTASSIVP